MIISTDSTSNLTEKYYQDNNISMIPLQINIGEDLYNDLSPELPLNEFYQKMRNGAVPKTAQINRETAIEYFENLLKSGEDVLHISFSSALSGNTDTIIKVADELNTSHSNKVLVFDSLNASMGEGQFVVQAVEMKNKGLKIDEIYENLVSMREKSCAFFTVDNLKYLVRGGRLGKISGIVGSILNIKPILHVNNEGKLVSYKKVLTRKKSILELANICANKQTNKDRIYICHADAENEAKILAEKVNELIGATPQINDLTQVIGSHTGPGLIALFFLGNEK